MPSIIALASEISSTSGSSAALRRTARFGDGWHTLRQSPRQVADALPGLRELTEAAGRDPAALRISISLPVTFDGEASARPAAERTSLKGPADAVAETIRAYAEAGVDRMILNVNFGLAQSETLESIHALAESVIPYVDVPAPARTDVA